MMEQPSSSGEWRRWGEVSIDVIGLWLSAEVNLLGGGGVMQLSVSSSAAQLWICFSAVWPSELHAAHRQKDAEASSLCGFPLMEVDEFWFVVLPNAMCFKACRKCLNTGLIVGPSKQLIMGEKDDEGRSIGVVHSNVQGTFELSSLKRLKRYSWTGYVSSLNRKNSERWKDLNVSFIYADMGHKF